MTNKQNNIGDLQDILDVLKQINNENSPFPLWVEGHVSYCRKKIQSLLSNQTNKPYKKNDDRCPKRYWLIEQPDLDDDDDYKVIHTTDLDVYPDAIVLGEFIKKSDVQVDALEALDVLSGYIKIDTLNHPEEVPVIEEAKTILRAALIAQSDPDIVRDKWRDLDELPVYEGGRPQKSIWLWNEYYGDPCKAFDGDKLVEHYRKNKDVKTYWCDRNECPPTPPINNVLNYKEGDDE